LPIKETKRDCGRTIKVPEKDLYETRLSLAGQGIPQGGSAGFKIMEFHQSTDQLLGESHSENKQIETIHRSDAYSNRMC